MTTVEIALIFSGVINVVLAIALIVVIARKAKNKIKRRSTKLMLSTAFATQKRLRRLTKKAPLW